MKIEDKLNVLSRIAHRFNEARVIWAVGGSALLYLQDIADTFHDIDLMIMAEDTQTVMDILSQMGMPTPSVPNAMFVSKSPIADGYSATIRTQCDVYLQEFSGVCDRRSRGGCHRRFRHRERRGAA